MNGSRRKRIDHLTQRSCNMKIILAGLVLSISWRKQSRLHKITGMQNDLTDDNAVRSPKEALTTFGHENDALFYNNVTTIVRCDITHDSDERHEEFHQMAFSSRRKENEWVAPYCGKRKMAKEIITIREKAYDNIDNENHTATIDNLLGTFTVNNISAIDMRAYGPGVVDAELETLMSCVRMTFWEILKCAADLQARRYLVQDLCIR